MFISKLNLWTFYDREGAVRTWAVESQNSVFRSLIVTNISNEVTHLAFAHVVLDGVDDAINGILEHSDNLIDDGRDVQ